jgi:hypothetical protein
MAIKQDVNAPLLVTIGVISALLLLIAVFGVQAWFFHEEESALSEKWDMAPNVALINMKADQKNQIESAGTNRNDTKARTIPIEVAMQKIVDLGGKLPSTQPAKK